MANPGSTDTTVPPLNPIDPTLKSSDYKTVATNLDLFIEHGSTPEGTNPLRSMLPFGDNKTLTPQEIADVVAYVLDPDPAQPMLPFQDGATWPAAPAPPLTARAVPGRGLRGDEDGRRLRPGRPAWPRPGAGSSLARPENAT